MSLAQRFERRLESMVGAAFARVFKGQVEPVEIGNALQREAVDKKAVMGNGQVLVPNRYRVTLGSSDYERLQPWEAQLTRSLAELVQEYLDDNSLATIGDIEVYLAHDQALHTGVFGVASRMEPQAPPRRRPMDSMSMPVVAGRPDEYVQPYGAPAPQQPQYAQPQYAQPQQSQYPPPQQRPRAEEPPPTQFSPVAQPTVQAEPRRPAYQPRLSVDGTPRVQHLKPGSNIVGRGTGSDLQLMDQGVSRRHADLQVADGQTTVHDLGSTNGTLVNGHQVRAQPLQHGDVIRVGHTRLVFHEDDS
ncbi:MAG: FHA domain-containing protein [Actinobacteria bacterium]|nr:FHA domain-containing protein [Actinomycetota bacterium]